MMLSIPVYSVSTQITKPYVEKDMVEKGHGLIWCTTLTVSSKILTRVCGLQSNLWTQNLPN